MAGKGKVEAGIPQRVTVVGSVTIDGCYWRNGGPCVLGDNPGAGECGECGVQAEMLRGRWIEVRQRVVQVTKTVPGV
jgi:hypothetical protein